MNNQLYGIKHPHIFQPLIEPDKGVSFMFCVCCGKRYAIEMEAPLDGCPAFERFVLCGKEQL